MYQPVLPAGLIKPRKQEDNDFSGRVFGNNTLKMGVVLEVIEQDSEDNQTKLGPEYNVMAIEQDKHNGINTAIYKNCIAIDTFGGVADFFQFKRRPPEDASKVRNSGSTKNQDGEIVLLLCLDGNAEKAVIIGSIAHPGRKIELNPDDENHAEGEFNGIRFFVDKDGALVITQKTATDSKGKPMDTSAAGSQWKMEKDGSTEINTAPLSADLAGGNDLEAEPGSEKKEPSANLEYDRIRIDRPSKSIQIEARENIDMVADKNLTAKVEENIDLQMKKDLLLKAEGKANIEVTGMVDFKTDAMLKMKMMNLQMTIDNAAQIQMQTMNLIAQQLTVQGGNGLVLTCAQTLINSPLVVLGAQPQPALIMNTNFLGTGNLGIPVISTAIGPYSSQVMVSK